MTDNDNKNKLTGKLQLKKTINAGQIKQSFSHGRSRSVSVEVKKKRSISGFSKNEKVEQPKSPDISLTQPEKNKRDENPEIAVTENKTSIYLKLSRQSLFQQKFVCNSYVGDCHNNFYQATNLLLFLVRFYSTFLN